MRNLNDVSVEKREHLLEKLNSDCREIMTKCVRLELIPMKYLLSEIRSSGLFPSDNILDILTKQSKYNSKSYNDEFRYRGMYLPGINLVNDSSHMTIENGDCSNQAERCDSLRLFNNEETASKNSTTSSTSILQDPLVEETRENDEFHANENETDDINLPSTSRNPVFRIQSDGGFENPPSENKPEYSVPNNIPHESMSTPSLNILTMQNLNRTSEPETCRRSKKGFTRAGSLSQVTSPKCRQFSNNLPHMTNIRLRQPLSVGNFQMNRPDRKLFPNSIKSNSIDSNNLDGFSQFGHNCFSRQWMKHQISTDDYWQHASANIAITLNKPSLVNHIRLRLWDKELRSYSYYIDVSYDKVKWTTVVDYRDYECRSFQQIFFPTRVIQYIRIVGTKNTTSNYFHLTNVECMLIEKPQISVNGFICPNTNVAQLNLGATVLEGVSRDRNALISSDPLKYKWKWGYTCHQLGNGAILVQLGQPYFVASLRFLLYDHDDRSYGYTVEIFDGKTEWKMVSDKSNDICRSWQMITFKRQLVSYIKVIGKNNTADKVFHLIHLECPYLPVETDSYAEKMKSDQTNQENSLEINPVEISPQINSSLSMTNNINSTNAPANNEDNQSQESLIESLTPSLPLATDVTDGSMHFSTNSSFIE